MDTGASNTFAEALLAEILVAIKELTFSLRAIQSASADAAQAGQASTPPKRITTHSSRQVRQVTPRLFP